jgi:flagellar biosynthesis protein FlhG
LANEHWLDVLDEFSPPARFESLPRAKQTAQDDVMEQKPAASNAYVPGVPQRPPMIDTPRFGLGKLGAYARRLGLDRRSQSSAGDTARVLNLASGKGGTGKSVMAANLAISRAKRGERVLLVDFDAGLANAHLMLGLAPRYDLSHVLTGEVEAIDALEVGPHGLRLLSGGVGRDVLANPTRRELDRLYRALRPLEDAFDLIIIDHGAGLGYSLVTQLAATSTMLLVTNHEATALSDSYALYKRAHLVNPYIRVGLVINRVPSQEKATAAWERFRGAAQRFLGHAPEWVGWVPADPSVSRSIEARVPVVLHDPESPAARALSNISEWKPIEHARSARPFFERARGALR